MTDFLNVRSCIILDALSGRELEVDRRKSNRLTLLYPSRFTLVRINFEGEKDMPKLPPPTVRLPDGAHQLIALSVQTVTGRYGDQEEVTAADADGQITRIWIPHNARKRIETAALAGLVTIDANTENWVVNIGSKFQVFIAAGKMVGLVKQDSPPPA